MPNNHVDKPFLTYEQMLELLESRNVLIVNHDFAKGLLASVSYYTLINGYKHMFSFDENDRFDPPVLFEDFHILHQFIFELSSFLLKYIINIENSLKSHLSYIVSKNYGVETDLEDSHRLGDTDYLAKVHYRNSSLSGGILNAIREQSLKSKNVSLIHYRNNHNHIPCWILVNGIPFGLSIEWYRILKAIDKQHICNQLCTTELLEFNEKLEFVINGLRLLKEYRNNIAHGNIVFTNTIDVELPKKQTMKISQGLITSRNYNNGQGRNDLFATILTICTFTYKPAKNVFLTQLSTLLTIAKQSRLSNTKTVYEVLNLPTNLINRLNLFV